jgi:hypothetical protein
MNFHQGAEREVPHHEQVDSSLPISCRQRGQSVARWAINCLAYYFINLMINVKTIVF